MPYIKTELEFPLDAAGTAVTVSVLDTNHEYTVTGSKTITVDNTFGSTGSLTAGITYKWKYRGVAIYSGGAVKFHGVAMTAAQALSNYDVVATYNGSTWDVDFIPDLSQNSIIEGTKLVDDTVGYEKIQEVSPNSILGNPTGLADNIQEIPITAAGVSFLSKGTAADLRAELGLGDIATQDANAVTITGGAITGITDLAVADGGTGAGTAAAARTNLGFADGEWTPTLTSVANIAASTAFVCQYIRVGNRVSFAGKITIDPTAAGPTPTQIRISLPIASNFASATDASGTFHAVEKAGEGGGIYADTVNDELLLEYGAADAASNDFYFSGIYKVI